MNRAINPTTTNAMAGPTAKCRLPASIGTRGSFLAPSEARPEHARGEEDGVLTTFECATAHPSAVALLLTSNRPRLRRYAVPFEAVGARPPLGHAHLRRPLLAGRVEQAVPEQPVEGADRAVGRLRPSDADRLRPRRRTRRR